MIGRAPLAFSCDPHTLVDWTKQDIEVISIAPSTDAALIHQLVHRAWTGTVDPRSSGHRFSLEDATSLLSDGVALVAQNQSGEPVGSVVLVPDAHASVELMKLAVPSNREQGVGTALLDAAAQWARERGATEIVLAVSAYEPHLTGYYARRGYRVQPNRTYGHAHPSSPQPIVMTLDLLAEKTAGPVGDAARALQAGHLVVIPTETVYGLGALASDPVAVRRVFATKGRPVDHPLIVHVSSAAVIDRWAINIPDVAYDLAAAFWPGPLTLVLTKHHDVPTEVTGGLPTVALRVPAHPVALAVLGLLPKGSGIAAPSANRFGKVSPTSAADARELLPFMIEGDLVLDGGPSRIGVESTILDLTSDVATILRPGGISAEQIEAVLGHAVKRIADGPSRAPGMLPAHYAPQAGVRLSSGEQAEALAVELHASGAQVGLLAPHTTVTPEGVTRLASPTTYNGDGLAPILYARLREADALGLDVLVVVVPDELGLGWAVADRLRRAAHGSSAKND